MNLNGYDASRPLHGVPYTSVSFKIDGELFKLRLDLESVETYDDLYSAIELAIFWQSFAYPELGDMTVTRIANGENFISKNGQLRTGDTFILSFPGHELETGGTSSGWEVVGGIPSDSPFYTMISQGSSTISPPPNSNDKVVDVEDIVLEYDLSVSTTEIDEGGDDTITFTVTASDVSDVDVQIPFTLSGTAVSNEDYQGSLTQTSFFTIPAGETSSELSFTANVDWFVEDDELVILTLGKLENQGSILEGKDSEKVVIYDAFQGKNTSEKWTGTAKNDKAFGNGGNDILSSGLGDDNVDGGDGNDKITGGKDADILSGGDGKDSFIFKKGDSNSEIDFADIISDLEKGERIDLSSISKTFNFIKAVASDLEGSNLKLSSTKFDVYVADLDGDNYLVYETVKNGSSYEIVAVGTEIPDVSSWTLKSGIFTV
jgi:Ca2+-binding RTX toxin-like protein